VIILIGEKVLLAAVIDLIELVGRVSSSFVIVLR